VLDLTKLTDAELDALDINDPVIVKEWMDALGDRDEVGIERTDDEERVFWHLVNRDPMIQEISKRYQEHLKKEEASNS
jgi:hypothetical protein